MNSPIVRRAAISALHSKISDRAPFLRGKLHQALNLLDDYEKTGIVYSLHWAVKFHREVVEEIGNRPPEMIEEMPR
jgi:hypothetical protein